VAVAQLLTESASDAYIMAPLACALASAAMTLAGTLHPPGGATAVLAVADPGLRALRWQLVPLVAISCTVMVAVACLLGNIMRRYPAWWWTIGECGTRWTKQRRVLDPEVNDTTRELVQEKDDGSTLTISAFTEKLSELHEAPVLVTYQGVLYPPDLDLGEEELAVLEALAARLEARKRHHTAHLH
jgi:HPP family